jgi:hypothetical protein
MDAPDGHAIPGTWSQPDAKLQLRAEQFDLMTRVVGYASDAARARLLGVNERTMRRARQGIIGEVFVAHTVAALRRHEDALAERNLYPTLDSLFEVVELASERAA